MIGSRGEPGVVSQHVLLVDDEPNILRIWRLELEDRGYRVSTAASAVEVLALAPTDLAGVDVVVTDHRLPGLTGLELAAELAERRPGLPVLLTTGGQLDAGSEPPSPHVRAVLNKPFFIEDLVAALRQALDAPRPSDRRG
jgi:DNA-binding NtrC family response regulator